MPQNQFTIQDEVLEASRTETSGATGDGRVKTATARAGELWVVVTAITGTAAFFFETSLDGTNFFEIGSITGVTGISTKAIAFNRADQPLGTTIRVRWTVGTTVTFEVRMGRME